MRHKATSDADMLTKLMFRLLPAQMYQNILGLNVLTIRIGHKNDAKTPVM